MEKPDIDYIKKRAKAYEAYYQQLHEDQKEIDDYYELVFKAGIPEGHPTRMPSTARDWIDVGVRHFTLDNPKSRVYPRRDSDAARNQVALLEMFYNFWLRKDIARIKDAAKKLLLRGEVFLKVNMDATYFGSESTERLFHFPLYLTVPDPINVYASPAHNGLVPVDVIEKFNITVAEAEDICARNGWKWSTKKAPNKQVEWLSFINANWRCFMIDNEPVIDVQPNILGFCPYVHVPCGAGQTSYEGKPEYLYRSLIWGKKGMLQMEVRNLSQIDEINSRYAWIKAMVEGTNPEAMKKLYPDGKLPTDPNELIYSLKDEAEIKFLQGEQPPPGLFTQQAMIQSYATPPAVLGGIRPSGVFSSQHQETLIATAKPIYKDPFKNLEDGLGVTMGMGAKIEETIYKHPIEIKNFASEEKQYNQIKPSDIKGHYDCEVQLLAEPPEATDGRKLLGSGLRKGGSISLKTELREYHDMPEKEAMDEIAQINAEKGLASVGMQDVVAKDGMSRLGMDRALEELTEAEKNAAKNIPPPKKGKGAPEINARVRGRTSPSQESIATPHEEEVAGELA